MNIFTNDDYRRIQAWLKANAIKDSDFTISENTVPDEDILVITQNVSTIPTNYRIKIKDLLNSSLGKIVIDKITANVVKVNNTLTVDAANVKLDNEKGTTLQDIIDWTETIEKAAKGWNIEYQVPSIDEPTVRAKYVLKDSKGVPKGDVIKVYKDSAITNVYLGTTKDACNENTGEVTKEPVQNNNEALSIVYRLDTGKYSLVNVPIGIFTREAEFDKYKGLGVTENGQVFVKLASDVESSNYLHFNDMGEVSADGIENRILQDLGTIINSVANDGTMWGQYKKEEGTKDSPINEASRWGQYKQAEADRSGLLNIVSSKVNQLEQKQIQGGVYDVSAHNDGAVFESLQALLSSPNLSTLIPISVRHGGMMIRFIQGSEQSSDNKYVQYRLMSTLFSTAETDWQNVDDKVKDIEEQLTTLGSNISELEAEVGNEKDIQKIFSYADSTDDDLMFSVGANKVIASTQNYWGKVFRLQEGLQYNSNAKLYLFNHKPTVDDSDYKEVIDYSARFTANDNLWAVTVAMSSSTDIKLTTYAHGIKLKLPQIETNKQNISKISDDITTLNDYVKDTDEKLGLLSETTDSIFMSTLERTENLCNPFKINFASDLYSNSNNFISYNKKNTSILAIYEINGKEGDHYYFFVADQLLNVGNLFVWTADEFPSPNSTILQMGSPASNNIFRGNVLLNQDTKYLIAEVRFGYNTPTTDDIIEQYRYMFIHNLTICKKYIDKWIPYYKTKEDPFRDAIIKRRTERTLFLNNDVLAGSSFELGSGWQGNLDALTHTSGTSPVIVNFDTVKGKKYLFCCTLGTAKEHSLFVTIGELAAVDTYNGTNTVNIGFISNGGKLKITPESSFVSTVSNIKLYEIVDDEKDSTHSVVLTSREVDGNNMPSDISGFYNVSIGDLTTLSSLINGSRNIAIGVKSLGAFTSGTRNIGVGTFTMSALKSGDHNIAIGADAFFLPEKLDDSISIGYGSSGWSGGVSFNKCVAIGTYAFSTAKGNVSESIAVGQDAMRVAQTDIKKSVAVGTHAGYYSGNNNTYIGWYAGAYTKGDNNVAIGHYTDKTYVTGSQNTFVGSLAHAGDNNASASNIETIDNAIVIGYSAIAKYSNEIVIGNRSNNKDYIIIGNKKITFNSDGSVTWSIKE